MPIFEYKCEKCNIVIEEYLPISSNINNVKCWKCGGEAKKIISNSTFVLKGGGWFAEGYSKKDGKK